MVGNELEFPQDKPWAAQPIPWRNYFVLWGSDGWLLQPVMYVSINQVQHFTEVTPWFSSYCLITHTSGRYYCHLVRYASFFLFYTCCYIGQERDSCSLASQARRHSAISRQRWINHWSCVAIGKTSLWINEANIWSQRTLQIRLYEHRQESSLWRVWAALGVLGAGCF